MWAVRTPGVDIASYAGSFDGNLAGRVRRVLTPKKTKGIVVSGRAGELGDYPAPASTVQVNCDW